MIHYQSAGKASVSAIRKIFAEIGAFERRWWRGAIALDADPEAEQPALLEGRTALFHGRAIPDPEDVFMAFGDALFILERLRDWAKRFRIKWHVRMNDDDWGAVDATGYTRPLRDQLQKWSRRAGVEAAGKDSWAIPEERRAELLSRHAGRH